MQRRRRQTRLKGLQAVFPIALGFPVWLAASSCTTPEAEVEPSVVDATPEARPPEPVRTEAGENAAKPDAVPEDPAPVATPETAPDPEAQPPTPSTDPDGEAATPPPDQGSSPEFAQLEKELVAKWEAISTLTARLEMINDRIQPKVTQRRRTKGTFDLLREDGKTYTRTELSGGNIRTEEEGVIGVSQSTLGMSDGTDLYVLRDLMGTKRAYKVPLDRGMMVELGGQGLFEKMRAVNFIEIRPREELDGREVIVIFGKQRTGDQTAEYYFDPETGAMVRSIVNDPLNSTKQTLIVTDIILGIGFNAEHFTFVLPDGVELKEPFAEPDAAKESEPKP